MLQRGSARVSKFLQRFHQQAKEDQKGERLTGECVAVCRIKDEAVIYCGRCLSTAAAFLSRGTAFGIAQTNEAAIRNARAITLHLRKKGISNGKANGHRT